MCESGRRIWNDFYFLRTRESVAITQITRMEHETHPRVGVRLWGGRGESEKEGLLIIEINSFARSIPVAEFSVHADGYEIKDGGWGEDGFFSHTPPRSGLSGFPRLG